MKREFGSPLIERFFPTKDLCLVADTSGAYIPGHGTPTVIIVGRNQRPSTSMVRAVLGVRGEPGRPDNPAKGKVWSSIVEHVDDPGWSDEWVTITDLERALLAQHPWSLTGGGTMEVQQYIEQASTRRLDSLAELPVGRSVRAGADEAFVRPRRLTTSGRWPSNDLRPLLVGDEVRDWRATTSESIWYPYVYGDSQGQEGGLDRELWAWRTTLASRRTFQGDMAAAGLKWWEYMQHTSSAYRVPLSIAFAFVATHNHFVLDRGGKVFKQSAPVIKLPEGATEDDHLALLGVLNSSTACFWLKQNSHNKGSQGVNEGFKAQPWERFYEFTGTTLQDFPLPSSFPLDPGRTLDALAQQLTATTPAAVCAEAVPTRAALDAARATYDSIHAEMIAQQEELDWEVYRLYGLVDEDLTYPGDGLPGLALGERAFEIVLAHRMAAGEEETAWFARHGSTPVTEIPALWPAAYRDLVARRIELIGSHPYLRLLERPEHKRRWAAEPWEKQEDRALRGWLLDRLEDRRFWYDPAGRPTPRSVANLADDVARDPELTSVLALWEGRPDVAVATSLQRLLAGEAVPYLAAYRYKDSGLRKRQAWEHTWDLQRREDAGAYDPQPKDRGGDGPIPVPPKYTSADFARTGYWAHRGKLDVPKERFILYPDAGRETDPTPVLGWAGWDHARQALALATLIQQREADGWADDRLVPLVAGLAELQPWVEQWHGEPDPFYGGVSAAEFFREQLDQRCGQVGMTRAQLAAWRPTPTRRGRSRKSTQ
ncbi:MAG: BREX-2 system adenine-specific DNA-methyltransferase PglX [Streptomycetales bacterium]